MFKEIFGLPLKIINIPAKIIDKVVFDDEDLTSAPLDALNEGVEAIGEALDDCIDDIVG